MCILVYIEDGKQKLPFVTMISTGIKSLFLVVVVLTFYRHVVSVPLLSAPSNINNSKLYKTANYSVHREETGMGRVPRAQGACLF